MLYPLSYGGPKSTNAILTPPKAQENNRKYMPTASAGDIVRLISSDAKAFLIRLEPGTRFYTHQGFINHDDLVGAPYGTTVRSHQERKFVMVRPSMEDLLMDLSRDSQIVFPKDIGYILMKLTIVPGRRVIEAGSGSGVLTCALARYVSPGGHIYSYDVRVDMLERARSNVTRLGLADTVTFTQRDITEGFNESDADAIFLDVREPWLYLEQARQALAGDGCFGAIVPTMNQAIELVAGLGRLPFTDIELCELMLRQYKPVPARVRPDDRLTAHTGYLAFARKKSRIAEEEGGEVTS